MNTTLTFLFLFAQVSLPVPADAQGAALTPGILLEAESFTDLGGWALDQQFMDLMGSPFLLAHGMGVPVGDATHQLSVPKPGRYRLWVRTRDWVAPWGAKGAPGRFKVLLDGVAVKAMFGTEGELWHWQDGGVVELGQRTHVTLHDLTGFEGRCDALLFSPDVEFLPPDGGPELEAMRRHWLGLPGEPEDGGTFDLVVVGGGTAGICAAVTAARQGMRVALIQDRPVLGGNASSEVRVWPEGHVNQKPYPRIGDVVMEVVPERRADSKNAQGAHVFDDDRKLRVARAEPNLTLFLESRMNNALVAEGTVNWVEMENVRSARRTRITGRLFADCTGDGVLGALIGADFEQTDKGHMGSSNLWNIQCLCEDEDPLSSQLAAACEEATFPRCPWAVDLTDRPFPGRTSGSTEPEPGADPISLGNWFWESGFDRDPIADMERVRDQNFRAMYGAWDVIKNVEKRYPAHKLGWVAYIAGKRESRRLLGDVILTGENLRDGTPFNDGCFPCTWGIDTHHPHADYSKGHEQDEFISDYTHGEGYEYKGPYWAPYRCLYSRNVSNLFMAGRDISVTHEALGAVRVMKTTGAMGEIVGMAASVCKSMDCTPREVYTQHLEHLKALMKRGAGRVTRVSPDQTGKITLSGRSARLRGKSLRYEADKDSIGYWRTQGDFAEWEVELPAPMRFDLEFHLSCASEHAGGSVQIHISGAKQMEHAVLSTGGWQSFQSQHAGGVELPAGVTRVSIVNAKAQGPLMKLRAITLSPSPNER